MSEKKRKKFYLDPDDQRKSRERIMLWREEDKYSHNQIKGKLVTFGPDESQSYCGGHPDVVGNAIARIVNRREKCELVGRIKYLHRRTKPVFVGFDKPLLPQLEIVVKELHPKNKRSYQHFLWKNLKS